MRHSNTNPIKELLNWKKWSIVCGIFIVGYLVYFFTLEKHGFLPELLNHVGLFLAAVVVVHFIYEILVKRHEQAELNREISDVVASTINAFLPSFERWGFHGFVDNLDFKQIFDRLSADDELLWLDTYAPSRSVLIGHVTAAVGRGAKVRMLAASPDSEIAKYRAKEIRQPGFTEQTFLHDLQSFIDTFQDAMRQPASSGSLELRLYDDLPSVPMYIHKRGGVPIAGFTGYFLSRASENFAYIKWTFADDGMLKYFTEYFEGKWATAKQSQPSAVHQHP